MGLDRCVTRVIAAVRGVRGRSVETMDAEEVVESASQDMSVRRGGVCRNRIVEMGGVILDLVRTARPVPLIAGVRTVRSVSTGGVCLCLCVGTGYVSQG